MGLQRAHQLFSPAPEELGKKKLRKWNLMEETNRQQEQKRCSESLLTTYPIQDEFNQIKAFQVDIRVPAEKF